LVYNFSGFLQDLCQSTGVIFNLVDGEENEIFIMDADLKKGEHMIVPLQLGKNAAALILSKQFQICAPLLKYTIEQRYSELFSLREQLIMEILQGKEVSTEKLEKNFPFLLNGCILFFVSVDGSRHEALNILRELYRDQAVISMLYEKGIIVIGSFEDVEEHANSIQDSIVSDLYCDCSVSYKEGPYDMRNLKKAYEHARETMFLGKQFDIKDKVLSYDKMLFEKVVHYIDRSVKEEFLYKFSDKFNGFDGEMINTIDEFVKSGLNISDAARQLYVHRNTLIYRLDKIYKETGFDIRNFREATIFIIAFLIWKENK